MIMFILRRPHIQRQGILQKKNFIQILSEKVTQGYMVSMMTVNGTIHYPKTQKPHGVPFYILTESLKFEKEGFSAIYSDSLVKHDNLEEVMEYFYGYNISKPMRCTVKNRDVFFGRDDIDSKIVHLLIEADPSCVHYIKLDIEDKNEDYGIAELITLFVLDF